MKTLTPPLQHVHPDVAASGSAPKTKKYDKPHMIMPDEDMMWALSQRSPVYKLWGECWRSDPYGSRWMPLKTSLKKENLKKAKKELIEAGLFIFQNRLTVVDGQRCYEWWVKNLHGCRSIYWKLKSSQVSLDKETEEKNVEPIHTNTNLECIDINTDQCSVRNIDFIVVEEEEGDTPFRIDSINTLEADSDITSVSVSDIDTNQLESGGDEGIHNTDSGTDNTQIVTDNTDKGTSKIEVGIDNTTQPYLNSLAVKVSKSLINYSSTSHKHFISSLSIQEREEFLVFCLKKINALTTTKFQVRTEDAWIARHYEQYWKDFQSVKSVTQKLKQEKKSDTVEFERERIALWKQKIEEQRIEAEKYWKSFQKSSDCAENLEFEPKNDRQTASSKY